MTPQPPIFTERVQQQANALMQQLLDDCPELLGLTLGFVWHPSLGQGLPVGFFKGRDPHDAASVLSGIQASARVGSALMEVHLKQIAAGNEVLKELDDAIRARQTQLAAGSGPDERTSGPANDPGPAGSSAD